VGSNPTLSVVTTSSKRRDMDKNLEDVWYEVRIGTALAVLNMIVAMLNLVLLGIAVFFK
jgi:hypothetical protein